MAANAPFTTNDDGIAETAAGFDLDGNAPWYAEKRTWAALAILAVMAVEFAMLTGRRDPLSAERRAVTELDDTAKTQLADSWDRFEKLTPDERRRIRDLHAAIEADADPEKLRGVLASYQQWKGRLSPQQSAALVGLPPPQRIEEIRKFAGEQRTINAKTLSNEDVKQIIAWLDKQVEGAQEKLLDTMSSDMREQLQHLPRKERNWRLIMSLVWSRGSPTPRLDLIPPQALGELRDSLSPSAQGLLDHAATPDARKQLLVDWVRQSVFRTMHLNDGGYASRVSDADIQTFFDKELTESERARYLALPREEMSSQLRRAYLLRKGLLKEPSYGFGRSPFGRGSGGPGGRGPGGPGDNRGPFGPGSPGMRSNNDGDRRDGFQGPPNDGQPPRRSDNPPPFDPRDDGKPNKPKPNGPRPEPPPPKPVT